MTTRWFVEVSPVDGDTLKERYCVEAPQWQQALQQARRLRGDRGALSRCSIELLEGGYRATDPTIRVRYMITRAPGDAPLTGGVAAESGRPEVQLTGSQPPRAPRSDAPRADAPIPSAKRTPLPERGLRSHSTSPAVPRPFRGPPEEAFPHAEPNPVDPPAPVVAAAPVPVPPPVSPVKVEEPIPSLPGLTLISRRAEEPREGAPMTYREYAFAVEPGLSSKELERYARATWEQVRTALAARAPGKFVQIALFDHPWSGRPERPPVAVIAWKDWRGDPVIQLRVPAAPAAVAAAPAAVAAPAAGPLETREGALSERPTPSFPAPSFSPTAPKTAAVTSTASTTAPGASAQSTAPTAPQGVRVGMRPLAPFETAGGRRGPSEDLISELFEEMHHLHFMPDIVTGAEYVLNVLGRVLPCEGVLVHVFDINTRQFVVVRALGPTSQKALLCRTPDTFPLFRETFRRARTLNFGDASSEEAFRGERWERLGVVPKSALCGAAQQGGRYLGVLELANPKGGGGFHDSEINAVDYICEQFADFVASRPIVLDDDAVIPRA